MAGSEGKSIFLENLVSILDENTYHNIISWSDDGRSFIIYNIKDFSEKILPLHFKHKNFSSFHRQLNLYGFSRDKSSLHGKSFKHSLFVKDRHELISKIHKKPKDSVLPLMLKKVSPVSKYLELCNTATELSVKSDMIGEHLEGLTEKVEELVKHNNMIVDINKSSSQDVERAKNFLIYFVNWIKSNPNKFNFLKAKGKENRPKTSEVEEIPENQSIEKLTYHYNDDFLI